jgi:quinol monooxygenase YgiN
MAKVAVVAKMVAVEGKRDELVKVLKDLFSATQGEAGTEVYAMHTDAADEVTVWFYELYTDQDAMMAHGTSEAMKAAGAQFRGLLIGRPEISFLTPVVAKGVKV